MNTFLLNIFNNGSQAWILLVMMIVWGLVFGIKTYLGHKKGYTRQLPSGQWVNEKKDLTSNNNFWLLIAGEVLLFLFLLWINSEYAK